MVFQGLEWTTTLIMFFFFLFCTVKAFGWNTRMQRFHQYYRKPQVAAVRSSPQQSAWQCSHQLWNFTAVCPNGRFGVNTQLLWVEDVWGHRQCRPECLVSSGCQWNLKAWHRRLELASISLWCHEKGSELGLMFLRSYSRNPSDAGSKGSEVKHSNMCGTVRCFHCVVLSGTGGLSH